ncbi:Gfo/Idh/MocA family protein [Oceanomicrobium pacificus]|uniref:Gfo/Idh/MocA family oxidoreductase n=1 Tax=Oceanomicrobium pacificus TaxID=2692916 RepID=A0A6B0TQB6_9RHOB|nr:Gfo/Idh/MocA family oxidoreductase [Oceanomicrobium pacificus]MXU66136.1 Gfo/Idh/MocA family oxidoreductase [Oceanomicrobium pacificus]
MLNIALVGAGLMGRQHLGAIARSPRARLSVLVDPSGDAEALATEAGAAWAGTLDAVDPARADAAIIASPTPLHAAHAAPFIAAGKPVLIEKPLADSRAAAQDLLDAEARGARILLGFHRRHGGAAALATELLRSGTLGQPVAAEASCWLCKPDDYFDTAWRVGPGGGPIAINLVHDLDLFCSWFGPPARVSAMAGAAVRGLGVEDTATVQLAFRSGLLATFTVSDAIAAPWSYELTAGENPAYPQTGEGSYRIGGTLGALELPSGRFWSHVGARSWWAPMEMQELDVPDGDPLDRQFEHFCDVIEGKTAPKVTAADGWTNLALLDAIRASLEEHRAVEVDA